LVAAITVVGGDLLPESIDGLGLLAIAVVFAGVFFPGWIEHAFERRVRIGLELGFAALVLHHIADGVAIALYQDPSVLIALVAHTIPVIAVVVLRFSLERGRKHAIIRAAILGAAIAIGAALGQIVTGEAIEPVEPWIGAAVAGLLLHVITHDLTDDPPATHAARALDFLAALAGIVVPIVASGFEPEVGERFLALALDFAPPLLLAAIAALVIRVKPREVSAATYAAWTIARRMLGIEALIVAFVFLGFLYTVVYVVAAAVLAAALGFLYRGGPARTFSEVGLGGAIIAWAIAGMMFASYVGFERTSFSTGDLIGGVAVLAVMTASPVAARMPLVAVLAYSGFPAGIAFASLLIDRTAVQEIATSRRAAAWAIVFTIALAAGGVVSQLEVPARSLRAPPIVAEGALIALGFLLAWTIYRRGARAYLAELSGPHHEHR
jgi:hypothetical protein